MTVIELIQKLQDHPPHMKVYLIDGEGPEEITIVHDDTTHSFATIGIYLI